MITAVIIQITFVQQWEPFNNVVQLIVSKNNSHPKLNKNIFKCIFVPEMVQSQQKFTTLRVVFHLNTLTSESQMAPEILILVSIMILEKVDAFNSVTSDKVVTLIISCHKITAKNSVQEVSSTFYPKNITQYKSFSSLFGG